MNKHRFMIELINKEDALDACSAQVWEGEAFADINCIKPVLTIPENPTNGDIIKALFPYIEPKFYTNLSGMHTVDIKLNDKVYGDVYNTHTFSADWWNAPYKAESEG